MFTSGPLGRVRADLSGGNLGSRTQIRDAGLGWSAETIKFQMERLKPSGLAGHVWSLAEMTCLAWAVSTSIPRQASKEQMTAILRDTGLRVRDAPRAHFTLPWLIRIQIQDPHNLVLPGLCYLAYGTNIGAS